MAVKRVPLKKHQQINKTQKIMFIWVAVTSILIGFSIVADYFIINKALFVHKVVTEKTQTVDNLKKNNEAVEELLDNVKALETNQALISTKSNEKSKAIQSVLDALPAERNEQALGASLQSNLLMGIPGVGLDGLSIESITSSNDDGFSDGDNNEATSKDEAENKDNPNRINFSFTITSNDANSIYKVLHRLERSIRVIQVDSLKIDIAKKTADSNDDASTQLFEIKVEAHAYYNPPQKIELKTKKVQP